MMRVTLMRRPGVKHDNDAISQMARGIEAYGDRIDIRDRTPPPEPEAVDAVGCWGWRHGARLRAMGHCRVLVLERGYSGDRFRWTSAGWNGLNGHAVFPASHDGGSRWNRHFAKLMRPWRHDDHRYALIMGQVPSDCSVREINLSAWVRSMSHQLHSVYPGRAIKFRPHPMAPNFRCDVRCTLGSLETDLQGAGLVVTYNSNSGVDAILSGVPTVATDRGSMVYSASSHSIAEPVVRPDRTAWAHALAWSQWLPQEFESGESWARLRNLVL